MMDVVLPESLFRDARTLHSREWLETNGRGGYALGPLSGDARRRYHSLLTVPLQPPLGRFQLVNRLEETAFSNNGRWAVASQSYPGVEGGVAGTVTGFRRDPFPVWTLAFGESRVEKAFFLRYGEDTAVLIYRLLSGPPLGWEVRPLLAFRDHHALGRRDGRFDGFLRRDGQGVDVDFPGGGVLSMWSTGGEFVDDPQWYLRQVYPEERERGLDFEEDVFGPGLFRFSLEMGKTVAIVLSAARKGDSPVEAWENDERAQRRKVATNSLVHGNFGRMLTLAADQFLVGRGEGTTVLAGYPWFGDWSRDALVAFPGLFLATGRWREGASMLDLLARHVRHGLLPNFFPEGSETLSYNSVDSPLWFIRAAQAYHRATHDDASLRRWLPVMRDIVDAFQNGAGYRIHMDGDGLIVAPESDVALTWMDARVRGRCVTPRGGKPVEIQALWYNALQFLVEIQLKLKEPTRGYPLLAEMVYRQFNDKFWNEAAGYVYDVVEGKHRDSSIRPNGLLTVSLPYEILDERRFRPLVDTAERLLLTPRGLRTLTPSDPHYRGRCAGNAEERNGAYHQGTVWPWLMGPYVTAYMKAHGATDESKREIARYLRVFRDHVWEGAVGQISEITDGDDPHIPRGCPAQAWSVGELLRVLWEEGVTL